MGALTNRLRERLLAGVETNDAKNSITDSLDELKTTEWSPKFEQHMRDRLVVGAFRYGKLGAPNKPTYDRVGGIRKHLALYQEDGNTEHLVDIANIALCEFVEGVHPKKHFRAVDDGEHVKKIWTNE